MRTQRQRPTSAGRRRAAGLPDSQAGRRAVFLDRDGTINRDQGHTHRIEDLELLPGAAQAIHRLNEAGYRIIVVTNQSGIGRGLCAEADVERFHAQLNAELARHAARIDAFYYCPHHPVEARGEYRVACECRKPGTALFRKAIRKLRIDVARSYMIGDSPSDIEAGRRVGLTTIQLGDDIRRTAATGSNRPDFVAPDLLRAVRLIPGIRPATQAPQRKRKL